MQQDELKHHGIKGMKWGVRKVQDGQSLYAKPKKSKWMLQDGAGHTKPMKVDELIKKHIKKKSTNYKAEVVNRGKKAVIGQLALFGSLTIAGLYAKLAYK